MNYFEMSTSCRPVARSSPENTLKLTADLSLTLKLI